MPKAQDLRQSVSQSVAFIIETLEMRNYLSTTLYYDANGSAAGVGGSGVWDHTSALWNTAADGSGNRVAWDGVSGVKSAVFGGVFGQVAIQSDVVVDSLSIQTPGYKIIGDHTLMFGSTGSITTAAGVDLRLSTKLSGSITISGDGVNAIILTRDVGRDNTNPSITVANGSLLRLSATQHLNALTLDAGAAARINQGGAKALVLNTLHIAGTLTTPTATLDVEDNAMIVTDANAAAQVFGWMVAGFGTGDWTGHGITSTIAATDPNGLLALGYANNIDLGASQFAGITLGNNDTIVKFTYYGDADLDGVVTLEDFSQFLYGYQQGGTPNWIDGDFDYSGTVTLEDFSLFLANHNTTPATPTYAIDGLDQTFTAGEEVTLSPRITNNIPLPAGTVFGWTVKQGNTVLFTSTGADFAYKLDENIAPTTLEVDLCVNNDEDHIISKTMDVDTPAGWTQVYTTFDYEITTDVDDFGGIEAVYNGVSTNWSEGIEGSGQIYYTPLHGDKTITLHLDHLPKHAYLNASGGLVINHQNYPEGSRMKTYVDGELVNDQLIDGAMDGLLVSRILPHTKSSATVTIVVTGLTSSDTWWVDAGVNTFLPTVTLDVNQSSTIEGQDFVLTATRTTPFTEAELNAMTPEEKAEMLPQMDVPLDWSGDALLDPTQSYLPGYVTIPAGEVSGDEYVYITDDAITEVSRQLSVRIGDESDAGNASGDHTKTPYRVDETDQTNVIVKDDRLPYPDPYPTPYPDPIPDPDPIIYPDEESLVDLDIDSDNNNGFSDPDMSDAEDNLEALTSGAKVFDSNTGDLDHDMVPDFADFDGVNNNGTRLKFVPVKLKLSELYSSVNPSDIRISFNYDASNPTGIQTIGEGTTSDPKKYSVVAGTFRLWKKDGDAIRSTSDFIAPGTTYSLAQLGITAGTTITYYLEAVTSSGIPSDISVKVKVTGNSDLVGESQDQIMAKSNVRNPQASFSFEAFIPNTLGDQDPSLAGFGWQTLPVPFNPGWSTLADFPEGYQGTEPQVATVFATDNRATANQPGTYKMRTEMYLPVYISTLGHFTGDPKNNFTTLVGKSNQAQMAYKWVYVPNVGWIKGCYIVDGTLQTLRDIPTQSYTVYNSGGNTTEFGFSASASNPFFAAAPSIDWDMKLKLTAFGDTIYATLTGSHNAFPAYAAYSDFSQSQCVYSAMPSSTGPGIWNLGVANIPVSISWII